MELLEISKKANKVGKEIFNHQFVNGDLGYIGEIFIQLKIPFKREEPIQFENIYEFVKRMEWDFRDVEISGRSISDEHLILISYVKYEKRDKYDGREWIRKQFK